MEGLKHHYVKRTQKYYSISFKLSVVSEIERGEVFVTGAQNKYGIRKYNSSPFVTEIWYL